MADLNTFGKVKHKVLTVKGQKPVDGSLGDGEFAINIADGSIFANDDNGFVVRLNLPIGAVEALLGAVSDLQNDMGLKLDINNYNEFPRDRYDSLDLDQAVNDGMYRLPIAAAAMTNAPSTSSIWESGTLLVIHGRGNSVTQIVASITTNYVAIRSGNTYPVGNGSWTDWVNIVTNDVVSRLAFNGRQLSSSDDIDTIFTGGVYRVNSDALAASINGLPSASSGTLTVKEVAGNSGSYSIQEYTTRGGYSKYIRKHIQNAQGQWVWNDWEKFLVESDLEDTALNRRDNATWRKVDDTHYVLSVLVPKALVAGDRVKVTIALDSFWNGADANSNFDIFPMFFDALVTRKAISGNGFRSAPLYLPSVLEFPSGVLGDFSLSESFTAVSGQPQTIMTLTFSFKDSATASGYIISDSEDLDAYIQVNGSYANVAPV